MRPQTSEVLGGIAQDPLVRVAAASDASGPSVKRVGGCGHRLALHIGDRGGGCFQPHFLVRAAQNRRVQQDAEPIRYSASHDTLLAEPSLPSV